MNADPLVADAPMVRDVSEQPSEAVPRVDGDVTDRGVPAGGRDDLVGWCGGSDWDY